MGIGWGGSGTAAPTCYSGSRARMPRPRGRCSPPAVRAAGGTVGVLSLGWQLNCHPQQDGRPNTNVPQRRPHPNPGLRQGSREIVAGKGEPLAVLFPGKQRCRWAEGPAVRPAQGNALGERVISR